MIEVLSKPSYKFGVLDDDGNVLRSQARDRFGGTPFVPEGNINREGIKIEPRKVENVTTPRNINFGEGGGGNEPGNPGRGGSGGLGNDGNARGGMLA